MPAGRVRCLQSRRARAPPVRAPPQRSRVRRARRPPFPTHPRRALAVPTGSAPPASRARYRPTRAPARGRGGWAEGDRPSPAGAPGACRASRPGPAARATRSHRKAQPPPRSRSSSARRRGFSRRRDRLPCPHSRSRRWCRGCFGRRRRSSACRARARRSGAGVRRRPDTTRLAGARPLRRMTARGDSSRRPPHDCGRSRIPAAAAGRPGSSPGFPPA